MQLSVTRQTYDGKHAAEVAYIRKPQLMRFIKEHLKLKHVNEAYVREFAEDVLHDGINLLLTTQYDCANADEAITEAMLRAVQAAARELSSRKEVPETLSFNDSKDGEREVSRFDLAGGTESAEDAVLEMFENYTLPEAVEMAESSRYIYGFDVLLALLLRAGTAKGLWGEAQANGLLLAYESVLPSRHYKGDVNIARVVSAVAYAEPDILIDTMRANLSRCDVLLTALGYMVA